MKRSLLIIPILLLAAVAVWLVDRYSKLPAALPEETVSAQLLLQGFYETDKYAIDIDDKNRPVGGQKSQQRTPRDLVGNLWFPVIEEGLVAPGKHPLLIYLPHYKGDLGNIKHSAELLASKGYLVAVLKPTSFIGSNNLLNNLKQQLDYSLDIRFLLDQLESWNQSPDTPFYSRIDFDRVAIAGYSTGGLTSQLLSFHPVLADPRIDLSVLIAPIASLFSAEFYQQRPDLPLLVIASSGDTVTPYEQHALKITENHLETTLVNIKNGSHAGFTRESRVLRWLNNPDFMSCQRLHAVLDNSEATQALEPLQALAPEMIVADETTRCEKRGSAAINTIAQHQLSFLAMQAFLESHFADTKFERASAKDYLHSIIATENDHISVFLPAEDSNAKQ